MDNLTIANIITQFVPLIIAVVVHEVAHGYTAYRLGDSTAKDLGRLSLNPIKHIDPFMTIILPGLLIASGSPVIFGGAKPVPVNIFKLRHPKRDMAIVAAAGPISNFILAVFGILAMIIVKHTIGIETADGEINLLIMFCFQWIFINVILGVFNLFPIPPLDGGRIMVGLLPKDLARSYAKIERFGLLIVIFLLYTEVIQSYLQPFVFALKSLIDYVLVNL